MPFTSMEGHPEPGCQRTDSGGHSFTVWAPQALSVELRLENGNGSLIPMQPLSGGYWRVEIEGVRPGDRYRYFLDGRIDRADPASHILPQGVHGPSAVVDHSCHVWRSSGFIPPTPKDLILYELHIGTFTPVGTFDSGIERLEHLARLGVTAVEVMPVSQFPGRRNWGYDGVQPYSVQGSYGGPDGFKRFVDACHLLGLAVILDVVYNHLGPEGNYLRDFGPYFTDHYHTPWGDAVNFDGPYSDHVRAYFLHNLLHWLTRYRVDGFRLDATHAMYDQRPKTFLREIGELAETVLTHAGANPIILAESDLNAPHLSLPPERGGFGLSGQFGEDFHHSVHALLTGERQAYYCDFGRLAQVEKVVKEGFAFTGEYSIFRERSHGVAPSGLPPYAIAGFIQNHDQVGNRAYGERLISLAPFDACRAGAALLLLSPYTPLLFMGEEYAEDTPFLYFVDHQDKDLLQAVRQGRAREFAGFFHGRESIPDPASEETMRRSTLDWSKTEIGGHALMLDWYIELIRLRKRLFAGMENGPGRPETYLLQNDILIMRHTLETGRASCLFNLSAKGRRIDLSKAGIEGVKVLDSVSSRWGANGQELPVRPSGEAIMAAWGVGVYSEEGAT